MIDKIRIQVTSGKGGNGAISGRREKYVPMGGPDGGDGGDGGSVYLQGDPNVNTLMGFRFKRSYSAKKGADGRGKEKHGRKGEDLIATVPLGTQVWGENREEHLLADVKLPGEKVCVARGGRGGRGNARFTSAKMRFPLLAEEGEPGEERSLRLELKLLADVGIVGAPNAGKSSLLAFVSGARPKIAGYPFTTVEPVLGVVEWKGESFVMVDIPGLIEGAHSGAGLGDDFLRHAQRTRVLVHLMDGSAEDPVKEFNIINNEMRLFGRSLSDKPQVVVLNKIDIPCVRSRAEDVRTRLSRQGVQVSLISVATGEEIKVLMDEVVKVLSRVRMKQEAPLHCQEAVPVLRPVPRRDRVIKVYRQAGIYVVDMPSVTRIAAMVDQQNWRAIAQFWGYLERVGIVRALEGGGVAPGDRVKIGNLELEWDSS